MAGSVASVEEQQAGSIPAGTELDANLSVGVAEPKDRFSVRLYIELGTNSAVLVDQLDRPGTGLSPARPPPTPCPPALRARSPAAHSRPPEQ